MGLKEVVLSGVATAEKSISNLKVPAQLIRRTPQAHVPGQAPTNDETTYDTYVVITSFRTFEIDGDRIKVSDLMGLVFPTDLPVVPTADDVLNTMTDDRSTVTARYRIIYNDKVMAGDQVALSQLQLRIK
jgi:hypothetical protein